MSAYAAQLKNLGDQIEAIADQMKASGNEEQAETLHRLGDEVEHFCDSLGQTDSAAKKSSSVVQSNQMSG